jgi:L-2-hydroxyglutarate oxidase LhgO
MLSETNVVIIGAGVIGLAIAAELAGHKQRVYVFEKNNSFGLETSSRNSQVVHAGIYYPPDSLKAQLCVEGKELLYDVCERYGIGYHKTGKIIVAVDNSDVGELERIREQGRQSGVDDLGLLSRGEVKRLEPDVEGVAGLLSPSSGIVDCHSLMSFLYKQAIETQAKFVFNTEVVGIEKGVDRYRVEVREGEEVSEMATRVVVNAAGLGSDEIAQLVGIDIDAVGYRLHYCKGEYFSLNTGGRFTVGRLIYPVPGQASLGIHVTPDLGGAIRLGPSEQYVDDIDYSVDESQRETFYRSVKRFLPPIDIEDLAPDFAGVRPKLQASGEGFRDFVISHEDGTGFPGLINLVGIESPGLTACPAIARKVAGMVREICS